MSPRCRATPAAVSRSPKRGVGAVLAVFVLAAACRAPPAVLPHTSRARELPRWERWAEAKTWPLARDPFVATGHGVGEYLVSVRASPSFIAEYRGLTAGKRWPVGAAVAAFHRARISGDAASIYVMTKRSDSDWEYLVSSADGAVEARGTLPLCARCHSDATADSLFGVPAMAQPSRSAESPAPHPRSTDSP